MTTTTATKSPKPIRRGHGAVLIPVERLDEWYARAIATPGLDDVERGVLAAIMASYRQLKERGYGMTLSYDRMAHHLNVEPVHVKWGVNHLVELGLVAVQPGEGRRPNEYLLALPKRVAASLLTAAADDVPVPPVLMRGRLS